MSKNKTLWVVFAFFVCLPLIELFGAHMLLFDFYNGRFEFAFYAVEANIYQLVVAVISFVGIASVLMALVLSHTYCGKFCPNTLFLLSHYFGSIVLSWIFSFSLTAYFIPSGQLFQHIIGIDNTFCVWFFYFLWITVLVLIVLLKRWYCSYLCIYGALLCNILPKVKKYKSIFVFIASLILIGTIFLIFDAQNLEYCEFANKELHYGK